MNHYYKYKVIYNWEGNGIKCKCDETIVTATDIGAAAKIVKDTCDFSHRTCHITKIEEIEYCC